MKLQGNISNWNDDKGYGFVEPHGGGERAFVHIKAFSRRQRRPSNGETIIYTLVKDSANRYRAKDVKFACSKFNKLQRKSKQTKKSVLDIIFLIGFCIAIFVSLTAGALDAIVIGLYIIMSLIAFVVYALDKSAAKKNLWRTQESTLHIISLIGGWPGALLAQRVLRHKSSKKEFRSIYWLTVILNVAGLWWLYTEPGSHFVNSEVLPILKGLLENL